VGRWTVIVKDTKVNEHTGEFIDWRLNLWGEAIDGAKQKPHPFPDEHDDDHSIEDAIVATTSVDPGPTKTGTPDSTDDTINRPVNAKPTGSQTPSPAETTATELAPPAETRPAATETASPTSTAASDSFLPSFMPTFGASKRTQIWIYAAIGSIIVFCIGLGIYFQVQRRKRILNNPGDDYDFEMIEDEDALNGATGRSGRTQRRGGELYNAFAGESDEEPLFSDEDDEPYRDRALSEDGPRDTSSDDRSPRHDDH
jgi:kexin